ncbi:hypothetical protein [Kozakia baliensis]|uniref:hypothetical protein n=1 Tax=Kozakia baliensis TaxID=153496 RepID=UPI0004970EB5|nr:hypothetical protein [Kozakia baliensis]
MSIDAGATGPSSDLTQIMAASKEMMANQLKAQMKAAGFGAGSNDDSLSAIQKQAVEANPLLFVSMMAASHQKSVGLSDLPAQVEFELDDATAKLQELMSRSNGNSQFSGLPKQVGNTGFQLSGNLSQDMLTLQQLVNGVGTNGSILQQYANAVGDEASQQGNANEAETAHGLAASLSDGTYSQQASSNAISSVMQGRRSPIENNIEAIIIQLASGQSNQSIGNNLTALAREAEMSGNSGLAQLASKLAGQAQSGSIDSSSAIAALHAQSSSVSDAPLQLSGNLEQDMQTLQQLVNGVGTNGSILQDYANKVSDEANAQGNGLDSAVAHNIGASLTDGTYSQQGSSNAISSALQGQAVDPLANSINAIIDQLKSGQSTQSIVNNLQALARQASNAGNSQLSRGAQLLSTSIASGMDKARGASGLQALANITLGAAPQISGSSSLLNKDDLALIEAQTSMLLGQVFLELGEEKTANNAMV